MLDDYIDGRLSPEERRRFESEMARDPELAREVALQSRIDDRLRRLLGRPSPPAAAAGTARRRVWMPWLAAAAAILLVGLTGVLFGPRLLESRVEGVYRRIVAAGFKPEVVCTEPEEFRAWVWTNYAQGLAPTDSHPGVEFVGWSYTAKLQTDLLGTYAGILLARVDGQPVIVMMNKTERFAASPPDTPRFSGLKTYRRDVGKLSFVEITPLDRPAVLDAIREVPAP